MNCRGAAPDYTKEKIKKCRMVTGVGKGVQIHMNTCGCLLIFFKIKIKG